jgi:hypothetical protein
MPKGLELDLPHSLACDVHQPSCVLETLLTLVRHVEAATVLKFPWFQVWEVQLDGPRLVDVKIEMMSAANIRAWPRGIHTLSA